MKAASLSENSRVLVVEDSTLIALDLEDTLTLNGYTVVGPAFTIEQATELISREPISLALLDLHLHGTLCLPLADLLQQRNIPFAFLSGGELSDIPAAYRTVAFLTKPVSEQGLMKAVRALAESASRFSVDRAL